MRPQAFRSTWYYIASLVEIAVVTALLIEVWSTQGKYMAIAIPLALVSSGISASLWDKQGGAIATGVSCALLLMWRMGHAGELTTADLVWAALYCFTALLLAMLALQRRSFEERIVLHEEEMAKALDRVEVLSRSKDEFLSLAAHELRNPVAVLVGSSDLLVKHKLSGADQEALLNDMHREARRMRRLIDDLFALGRFDAGAVTEREPFSIAPVAVTAVEEFHERYAHPVDFRIEESSPLVLGSKVQIEHAITNLLSSAGKFSPRGSRITLESRSQNEELEIDIRDRGSSMPEESTLHLFDALDRVPSEEETRSYDLGLAISKRLIEANGGRIWAKSREGGGLDVGFALPLFHERAA